MLYNNVTNPLYIFILENLIEEPDQPLNPHPEIGKYFNHWTGTRYIPNEYLSQTYPEDYR